MTAVSEHLRFELRSMVRQPSQLLLSYLFPLGFFLFMGAVMPRLDPAATATLVPAFALFAVFTGGILGLPAPLVEARRLGVTRAFRVIGVPDRAALGIPALANAVHGLAAATVVALVGPLVYGAEAPVHPAGFAGVLVLAAFAFTGLGSLIGVVSSDSRSSVLWSQSLFLPSMLLGGLMMPVSALPEGMRRFSALLPTSHLMRLHDAFAYGRAPTSGLWVDALAVFATGLVAFALATRLYGAEERAGGARRPLWVLAALAPLALTVLGG